MRLCNNVIDLMLLSISLVTHPLEFPRGHPMTWPNRCLLCQAPFDPLVTSRHDAANVCHRIRSSATHRLITSTIENLRRFEHHDAVSS